MGMAADKESVLFRVNEGLVRTHSEAAEKARLLGKPPPPAPVPLALSDVEFPKWVHKGWKLANKSLGHHKPEESEVARDAEHLKALLAEGYTEAPPPAAKADAKK